MAGRLPLSGSNFVIGNDIGIASDGTGIGNVIGIWVNDVPSTQIGYPGIGNDIADNTQRPKTGLGLRWTSDPYDSVRHSRAVDCAR